MRQFSVCKINKRIERREKMEGYKKIRQELAYKGHIIDVYKDILQLPNGNEVEWDFVKHKGASAVVAVDENGKILMVRQYRNAIDRMSLEIPAGGINEGEDPKKAAIRELEEETGYRAEKVENLVDVVTAIGFSNETVYTYLARGLKSSKQNLDEDEFIEIERYTVDELIEMIVQGKIKDAKTISGVLTYKAKYL